MVWNKDNQGAEYRFYRTTTLVVYHVVNDLYSWHVEYKDGSGRRVKHESGQDFSRDNCKTKAKESADKLLDR